MDASEPLTRDVYRAMQDNAYRRLGDPQIIPGDPARTMGELFPQIALTEAQSGQTPAHVFGRMALRLVSSGEATWRQFEAMSLSQDIARRMAITAERVHAHRYIRVPGIEGKGREARLADLAANNTFVFGAFMDHAFYDIAALSPEGARDLGSRIRYDQGIAHPSTAPPPRAVTIPYVERYLSDQETFRNVSALLQASTSALLGRGRRLKDAYLDRLERIGREHYQDNPGDDSRRREKTEKDMQARADLWRDTYELIKEEIRGVRGFTDEQLDNYAWNSSMVFVTPNTDLIPPRQSDA